MMNKSRRALLGLLVAALLLPAVSAGAQARVYFHGDGQQPQIAITMDDCWKKQYVAEMLDLCQEFNFHMTFFPCGVNIKPEDAALWQRMVDEGHEIGNHTQNHRKLTKLPVHSVREELRIMNDRLDLVLGYDYDLKLMRPPYGAFGGGSGSATARLIDKQGYHSIIMWSLSQYDPDKMLKEVKNGDILLYHSNHKDVAGLQKAIPLLLLRGFKLVTVSQLLGLDSPPPPAAPTPAL